MPYIYENDPTKIGTNLQTAVAYLLSLHKNEYEWNLLGIKVIGVKEALPIPDGTYDYGDAYMIGTEPPYDMYIYTRPDGKVHSEAYWFNIGKFPALGPQGPKGDGLEQIMSGGYGNIQFVQYDTAHGARVDGSATVNYVDSTTGMPTSKSFSMASEMPIVPGKYVSIAETSDKKNIEVKVDDTKLALDYYKIDKSQTTSTIPYWNGKVAGVLKAASDNVENSVAQRDSNGNCSFKNVYTSALKTLSGSITVGTESLYVAVENPNSFVPKTSTDTGVFTELDLANVTFYKTRQIQYDNKIYYYMDTKTAPNGTLNFIHLDSVQDGNGRHKATGKCFSINVNTREWKVFDLDFGGGSTSTTEIYRHGIVMNDANIVVKLDIYDNNSQNYTYEQLKAKLALNPSHCANARIKKSDNTYYYSPATIKGWDDSTGHFSLTYNNTEGNNVNVNWTPSVVADNGTQIL